MKISNFQQKLRKYIHTVLFISHQTVAANCKDKCNEIRQQKSQRISGDLRTEANIKISKFKSDVDAESEAIQQLYQTLNLNASSVQTNSKRNFILSTRIHRHIYTRIYTAR